jgi:hypothetical protein
MVHKSALGALSVAIGVVAYSTYLWKIIKDENIQPHPFSWLIWAGVTTVAALTQRQQGAGPATWVTEITACACVVIVVLSILKRVKWTFSAADITALVFGITAVLAYAVAKQPTAAAVCATIADLIGYDPTIRKGWIDPYTDSAISFMLNSAKFVPALFAIDEYSVATWLYPATLVVVNGCVAGMLKARRAYIAETLHRIVRENEVIELEAFVQKTGLCKASCHRAAQDLERCGRVWFPKPGFVARVLS